MMQIHLHIVVRQDQLTTLILSDIVVRFRELLVVDPHLERVQDYSNLLVRFNRGEILTFE